MKIYLSFLVATSLLFAGCGDKEKPGQPKPKEIVYPDAYINSLTQAGNVVVVDEESRPLANANVLFGSELNQPFQNNFLKTDDKGMLAIPKEWAGPLAVTVDLPTHIRVTYLEQSPKGLAFRMKKKRGFPQYEIYGETLGHEIKNYDDQVDFGLVAESMSKEDLLTFDINKIISPLSDVMSVVGFDLNIPGNLSLPKQKESYFVPLTLTKPTYRITTLSPGPKKILALRGRFPFKAVVDELRNGGKSYAELINRFDLFGGVLQDVNVTQNRTSLNLNTKAMNFTGQTQIVAPFFKSQETFLAISATEDNGSWFPTDIKKLEPSQQQALKLLPNSKSFVIGVLKNKNEFNANSANSSRMSAAIVANAPNAQFSLIPLIENPRLLSVNEFSIAKPAKTTGMSETGTYAVLSATNTLRSEIGESQVVLSREWEVYANTWIESVKLPKFPTPMTQVSRRFEISFIGSSTSESSEPGPALIESATHVTRSSIDF